MPDRALHVCEVLEEEHLSLYPDDAKGWKRDWRVDASQILDAGEVAARTAAAFPELCFRNLRPHVDAEPLAEAINTALIDGPLLTTTFPQLGKAVGAGLRWKIWRKSDGAKTLNRAILDDLLGELVAPQGKTPHFAAADLKDPSRVLERSVALFALKVPREEQPLKPEDVVDDLNALIDRAKVLTAEFPALCKFIDSATEKHIETVRADHPNDVQHVNRLILDCVLSGALQSGEKARLAAYYRKVHAQPATSAFCISGGGIRSATFALGLLQGLAHREVLTKFDYISTVSGGGYIGSWLSSWMRRHQKGAAGVEEELRECRKDPLQPEPQPVRHLREYSNYLTPKLGAASGDTWALAGTYVCNLLLNWLILLPVLLAVLALPRLLASLSFSHEAMPYLRWMTGAGLGLVVIGFAYLGATRPVGSKAARRNAATADNRFRRYALGPMVFGAALLASAWSVYTNVPANAEPPKLPMIAVIIAALAPLAAWLLYVVRYLSRDAAERHENLVAVIRGQASAAKKLTLEFIAALVGGIFSAVVLWLFAAYVFPQPAKPVTMLTFPSPVMPMLETAPTAALYICFAVPVLLLMTFIAAALFVGIASHFNEDYDREWWARASGYALFVVVAWPLVTAIVIFGPVLIYFAPKIITALGGVSGLTAVLAGKSGKTAAKEGGKSDTKSDLIAKLATPLAIVFILAALSLLTSKLLGHPPSFDHLSGGQNLQWRLRESATNMLGHIDVTTEPQAMFDSARASGWQHLLSVYQSTPGSTAAFIVLLALVAVIAAVFVNVNKFSMHAMYRNRLIRAYLGASRGTRNPNPFTGFDPQDNVRMDALRPQLLWFSSFSDFDAFYARLRAPSTDFETWLRKEVDERHKHLFDGTLADRALQEAMFQVLNCVLEETDLATQSDLVPPETGFRARLRRTFSGEHPIAEVRPDRLEQNRRALDLAFPSEIHAYTSPRPMHVVNMTLNLVAGDNLAWQERKAESFTVTPLHAGSFRLGYRNSSEYGDGISLGTAVAISGAAASPNMGYYSAAPLSFLMTLFNVRLGWWLGNPGPHGEATHVKQGPAFALRPLIAEATGDTNDQYPYVYLSDGGHFENFGLYEMVLRRRRFVVISDAACDPDYELSDLGNAIRKIRIDLGVPIEMQEPMYLYPRADEKVGKYCAIGRIRYSCIDGTSPDNDGKVIYIKPAVYMQGEPKDVYNYAKASGTFPHETTADQFFSESQFESYRMLGFHAMEEIAQATGSMAAFFADAEARLAPETAAVQDVMIDQNRDVRLVIRGAKRLRHRSGRPTAGKPVRE